MHILYTYVSSYLVFYSEIRFFEKSILYKNFFKHNVEFKKILMLDRVDDSTSFVWYKIGT